MTTTYAQRVHTLARQDIEEVGHIRFNTAHALHNLGYSTDDIAKLERHIKDRIYR